MPLARDSRAALAGPDLRLRDLLSLSLLLPGLTGPA
jgi:hypothetical protein